MKFFIFNIAFHVYLPFYSILWLPAYWLQLKDLQVFTVIRVIFQLTEEIPCISAVVVALLSEVYSDPVCYLSSFYPFFWDRWRRVVQLLFYV